jgi:hypothetical protein
VITDSVELLRSFLTRFIFQNQTQLFSRTHLSVSLKRLSFLTYFPTSTLLKVAFTTLYVDVKEPADLKRGSAVAWSQGSLLIHRLKNGRGRRPPSYLPHGRFASGLCGSVRRYVLLSSPLPRLSTSRPSTRKEWWA